jgi:hypothetical protein
LKILVDSSDEIEGLGDSELIAFELKGERTMRIEGSAKTRVTAPKSPNRFGDVKETRIEAFKFGESIEKIESPEETWMRALKSRQRIE